MICGLCSTKKAQPVAGCPAAGAARGAWAAVLLGLTLWSAAGCERYYPQPDPNAVYYFVAGAAYDGKVRVCWPAGRPYAESITGAYRALQKSLAPLEELAEVDALWLDEDPRWDDAEALKQRVDELRKTVVEQAEQRAERLTGLKEAVAAMPDDFPLPAGGNRDEYRQRLLAVLARGSTLEQWLADAEALGRRYLGLYEAALACVQQPSDGCRQRVAEQRAALRAELEARLLKTARQAARQEAALSRQCSELDKHEQRDRYLYLTNQLDFYKRQRESVLRGLQASLRKAREELQGAERQGNTPAQQLKLLRAKVEYYQRLQARLSADAQADGPAGGDQSGRGDGRSRDAAGPP